jgi:hypothetical protein
VSFGQSPTFKKDVSEVAAAIKQRCSNNGYKLLINYNTTADASFFVKPGKSYLVFYIYDVSPRQVVEFNAHLMTADTALQQKYTSTPDDVLVKGSAKVALLKFTTPVFKSTRLPIKVNADPKAVIYIYSK